MEKKGLMLNLQTQCPPSQNEEVLRALTVGLDKVSSFIRKEYFASFIKDGGSKVKMLCGKKGCGKSHLLALLSFDAKKENFITVNLDASEILLSDMTNLYIAIYKAIDYKALVEKVAIKIIQDLGYDFNGLEKNKTIMDWLSDRGESMVVARQEIRSLIKAAISDNHELDYNFAQILTLFVMNYLGLINLDDKLVDAASMWLEADSSLKISALRSNGLAGYKINKTNARGLLKSISVMVRLAGYSGLYVSLDNLDIFVQNSSLLKVKYTKLRRDDAYEVIRQLIDDVDFFSHFFLILAFDRILVDHEKHGIKSYQALWLRVQNELVSSKSNYFADLLDLDRINTELLVAEEVMNMSKRLSELFRSENFFTHEVTRDEAEEILKEAKYGSMSIPLLTNLLTLRTKEEQ